MTSYLDKSKKEKVSIVIPCYNRKQLLDECLRSVFWQDYANKEVIVIDDNSKEDISGLIKNKYPKVNLITNNLNKGPSFAKNQGIIASTGNYVLFLDSDSELIEKNILSKMITILQKDKKIGCLGGEAICNKKGYKLKVAGGGNNGYIFADAKKRIKACDFLNTSNCIVRRDIIEKTKGFDPYYFYPMEDTDFGLSIKRLGYHNIISFDIGALHKYSKQMRLNRIYMLYRAKTRFLIKNYSIFRAIFSIPFDISETMIRPAVSFIKKKKQEEGKEQDITIGPVENNMMPKLYMFIMTPFLLLRAYLWNIIHLNQTIRSRDKDFLEPGNMREYEKNLQP